MSVVAKRRREDPQVRRAQILQAAKGCFRTLGFQASTVDRIAAEAQVSVGLLYRFFDSKSAIIEAIILEDAETQLEQASSAIESAPAGAIETWLARTAETTFDRDQIALMCEIAAEVCRNRALQSFVRERRTQLKHVLVQKLVSKGLAKKAALQTFERLELIGAVASGAAIHAVLYFDGQPEKSMRLISKTINALAADNFSGAKK